MTVFVPARNVMTVSNYIQLLVMLGSSYLQKGFLTIPPGEAQLIEFGDGGKKTRDGLL